MSWSYAYLNVLSVSLPLWVYTITSIIVRNCQNC